MTGGNFIAQRFVPDYVLLERGKVEASLRILSRRRMLGLTRSLITRDENVNTQGRVPCQSGAFSSLSTLTDTFPRITVFD